MGPPALPDLDLMDFSAWSLLKAKVCSFAQETLRATVGNFRMRIKPLIESTGHHI